tara:strand:+ start:1994 stop:2215 length:222 start_codon:yes stop_codon:yes gene_type:complete
LKVETGLYCFSQFEIDVDNSESSLAISGFEIEDSFANFKMSFLSFLENLLLVFKYGLFLFSLSIRLLKDSSTS